MPITFVVDLRLEVGKNKKRNLRNVMLLGVPMFRPLRDCCKDCDES